MSTPSSTSRATAPSSPVNWLTILELMGPQINTSCPHAVEREEKYGQRVAGITAQSISGAEFLLPTLTECDIIPQDKCEIPTPSMARKFPHLTAIAHEIPPLDETAKVHLLIGQDAPALLKVRESRNGPRGSPRGQ